MPMGRYPFGKLRTTESNRWGFHPGQWPSHGEAVLIAVGAGSIRLVPPGQPDCGIMVRSLAQARSASTANVIESSGCSSDRQHFGRVPTRGAPGEYEFQILLGVRSELTKYLVRQ
jgi:hypothetical protein